MSIFKELNSSMNLDEMRRIIKENSMNAIKLKNKIKAIDAIPKVKSDFVFNYSIEADIEIIDDEDDIDEEEEFKYYYDNMMNALANLSDIEEKEQAIYDNMPSKENKNYVNIIRRIILELIKEREIYDEYLSDEDASVRNDAILEQDKLDFIINRVKNHHNVKNEDTNQVNVIKNNIIFLRTNSGNVYAENDLSSIDSEWYPAFRGLLESIEDGTFKNVKRLTSNRISQGIPEVKDYGVRIVFDKVNPNTYIILDMFVKKSDHDKGYSEQLINRLSFYRQNEDTIKKNVTEELIKNDSIILENIKSGLMNKSITKTKGGDILGL